MYRATLSSAKSGISAKLRFSSVINKKSFTVPHLPAHIEGLRTKFSKYLATGLKTGNYEEAESAIRDRVLLSKKRLSVKLKDEHGVTSTASSAIDKKLFSTMLNIYAKSGNFEEAFALFLTARKRCNLPKLRYVENVHKTEPNHDVVFKKGVNVDNFHYGVMLSACIPSKKSDVAVALLKDMLKVYSEYLKRHGVLRESESGSPTQSEVPMATGSTLDWSDLLTGPLTTHKVSKNRHRDGAKAPAPSLQPSASHFTNTIIALVNDKKYQTAVDVFHAARRCHVVPDTMLFNAGLSAMIELSENSDLSSKNDAVQLFEGMETVGVQRDAFTYGYMIKLAKKLGRFDDGLKYLHQANSLGLATKGLFEIMIGFALHEKKPDVALQLTSLSATSPVYALPQSPNSDLDGLRKGEPVLFIGNPTGGRVGALDLAPVLVKKQRLPVSSTVIQGLLTSSSESHTNNTTDITPTADSSTSLLGTLKPMKSICVLDNQNQIVRRPTHNALGTTNKQMLNIAPRTSYTTQLFSLSKQLIPDTNITRRVKDKTTVNINGRAALALFNELKNSSKITLSQLLNTIEACKIDYKRSKDASEIITNIRASEISDPWYHKTLDYVYSTGLHLGVITPVKYSKLDVSASPIGQGVVVNGTIRIDLRKIPPVDGFLMASVRHVFKHALIDEIVTISQLNKSEVHVTFTTDVLILLGLWQEGSYGTVRETLLSMEPMGVFSLPELGGKKPHKMIRIPAKQMSQWVNTCLMLSESNESNENI